MIGNQESATYTNPIRYGVEYKLCKLLIFCNQSQYKRRFAAPSRYADGGSTLWNIAGYLKHHWQLSTSFDVSCGLRYTYQRVDMRFNNPQITEIDLSRIYNDAGALSFSIATSYGKENSHWKGFTSLSSGFRSPNVDDGGKIFDPTPTELVLPSNALNPEYIYQLEQGFTWTYGKGLPLKLPYSEA